MKNFFSPIAIAVAIAVGVAVVRCGRPTGYGTIEAGGAVPSSAVPAGS